MESSDFISTSEMSTTNTTENETIQEIPVVRTHTNINGSTFDNMEIQMENYDEDCECCLNVKSKIKLKL